MAVNWHAEIVEQLDFYWKASLRPRLEGLADEEYFWEPSLAAGRSGPATARFLSIGRGRRPIRRRSRRSPGD